MIKYSDNFLKEAKKLSKKFKLLKQDLQDAVQEIVSQQDLGVYIGYSLYKKRIKNSSIPTGKSGGFRIIIYKKLESSTVLISIYAKTNQDTISDDELKSLVKEFIANEK